MDNSKVYHYRSAYLFSAETSCCLNLDVAELRADKLTRITISGGTPGARCVTVFGIQRKRTNLEGANGFCASFSFGGVRQKSRIIGGINRHFDANGEITFAWRVPQDAAGHELLFQSTMQNTCPEKCTSNLVEAIVQ